MRHSYITNVFPYTFDTPYQESSSSCRASIITSKWTYVPESSTFRPKRFVTSGFPKKQLLFEFNNIRLFSYTNYYYLCAMPGVDEGQRHSLGGRRRLFPRVQRNNVGDKRGKRPLLDPTVVPDDAAQHPRHQRSAPDPKRPRDNFWIHAGNLRFPIRRPLAHTIATNSLLRAIFNFQ